MIRCVLGPPLAAGRRHRPPIFEGLVYRRWCRPRCRIDGLDAVRGGAASVAGDGSPPREGGFSGPSNRDADAAVCSQEARWLGNAMYLANTDMLTSLSYPLPCKLPRDSEIERLMVSGGLAGLLRFHSLLPVLACS